MANTISSWSTVVSSQLTNASLDTDADVEAANAASEMQDEVEEALAAAAPGSSTELFNLFSSLPTRTDTEVKDANAWLADVTVPSIDMQFMQEDD